MGPSPPVFGAFDNSGTLSSAVSGVSVTFDGVPAPLFYAGPNQINIQVPYEAAGKQFTKMVANYGGRTRGLFTIPVRPAHPGIVVVTNANYSLNDPQSPVAAGGFDLRRADAGRCRSDAGERGDSRECRTGRFGAAEIQRRRE